MDPHRRPHFHRSHYSPSYYHSEFSNRKDEFDTHFEQDHSIQRDHYKLEEEFEAEASEIGRRWLPTGHREIPFDSGTISSDDAPRTQQAQDSNTVPSVTPVVVPKEICEKVSIYFSKGVLTETSKSISKEFPLNFEDSEFSLKPPRLDSLVARRAKYKEVGRRMNSSDETLTKIQLKIMDIGQPILAFYSRVKKILESDDEVDDEFSVDDLARGLEASLQQWGRAFNYLTKMLRETAVDAIDPRFKFLLKEIEALPLGKEGREHLFPNKFVNHMLKETRDEETLFKSDKIAAAMARRRSFRGSSYRKNH